MNQPHKHADLIIAWANGAEIEYRVLNNEPWKDCIATPKWLDNYQYRIKPERPKDIIFIGELADSLGAPRTIEVTYDGTTGDFKSSKVVL